MEIDLEVRSYYDVQKVIGSGTYGTVWRAIQESTETPVALKKIAGVFSDRYLARRTYKEASLLKEFGSHENIITLLGLHVTHDGKDVYLALEYMETDLQKCINVGVLEEYQKRYIMFQLLAGVAYLHSAKIIHRDLKPANILISRKCLARIADFGLARSVTTTNDTSTATTSNSSDDDDDPPLLTQLCGTMSYLAPEVLLGASWYTTSVDMWSLGCIFGEMMTGRCLFHANNPLKLLEKILSVVEDSSTTELEWLFPEQGNWLRSIPKTKARPQLSEMLQHAPRSSRDLVTLLLNVNPHERLAAAIAIKHPYIAKYTARDRPVILKQSWHMSAPDTKLLSTNEYYKKLCKIGKELRSEKTNEKGKCSKPV